MKRSKIDHLITIVFVSIIGLPLSDAKELRINDAAGQIELEIALDEIATRVPGKGFRCEKISTQPDLESLRRHTQNAKRKQEVFLVFYPPNQQRVESSRHILTNRVTVRLVPGTDSKSLTAKHGAQIVAQPAYAPDFFVLEIRGETGASLKLAETLRAEQSVLLAEPMLARPRNPRAVPNDPLFADQWHLLNTGQTDGTLAIDANVTGVWNFYTGKGVKVSVVDDGVESSHPDLAANAVPGYDYYSEDDNPSPDAEDSDEKFGSHGTAVAGIISAVGNNNRGVVGVAYESTIVPVRLLAANVTDQQEADALVHNNLVHVSNNSWGGNDDGATKGGAGPLVGQALRGATSTGRDGKGTIFVWAAGNGALNEDNANYDTYANSIYTITVGALNDLGKKADYSEPGACLTVSAPAGLETNGREPGIVTADLTGDNGYNRTGVEGNLEDLDYTSQFNGTSAATPVISGVIALMLEANPELGWRDVQEILITSATRIDSTDLGWMTNGAGEDFHHDYGSGLVNAEAAVLLAETWKNLPPQSVVTRSEIATVAIPIPDADAVGITRTFDFTDTNLRTEQIMVTVDIAHSFRGDLEISLISPQGTTSRLAEVHSDANADYNNFAFTSTFNWGEISTGEWKVQIVDSSLGDNGAVNSLQVEIFGTAPVAPKLQMVGKPGSNLSLMVDGHAGRLNVIETSDNLITWDVLRNVQWPNGAYEVVVPSEKSLLFYRVSVP